MVFYSLHVFTYQIMTMELSRVMTGRGESHTVECHGGRGHGGGLVMTP